MNLKAQRACSEYITIPYDEDFKPTCVHDFTPQSFNLQRFIGDIFRYEDHNTQDSC